MKDIFNLLQGLLISDFYKGKITNLMGNLPKPKTTAKDNQSETKQLKSLRLLGGTTQQLRQLITPKFAQNMRSLNLYECRVGAQGMKIMAHVEWPSLQNLSLHENKLQDKGLTCLIKCRMPNLIHLNLLDNWLRDASCKIIIKGNWPLIQTITINDICEKQKQLNKITTFGAHELKKIRHGQLKCLSTAQQYKKAYFRYYVQ